ncbi:MAG TPA: hypothetical protein VFX02_03500 [Gammaproteobacteria bacterium]|nr:hypothetical protein [Gammaproteobacteria bacterium]
MSSLIPPRPLNTILPLVLLGMVPTYACASCGSAFCTLNTRWDVQGAWTEPGTRFDFRFEYVDQDQLRHGTDEIEADVIPQHHDEIRTINRNALLTLDHAFSEEWSLSATLPLVDRRHDHIHNHHEDDGHVEHFHERWDYSEAGDLRLLGSYRPEDGDIGILAGVKLPTGATDIANDEGEVAERTLQPGSGTMDLVLGGFYRWRTSKAISWFGQLLWQEALSEQDDYKPGRHLSLDAGLNYYGGSRLVWMAQLNLVDKSSDAGAAAEPENSGGRFAYLSPGFSISAGDAMQLYAFVQQALYQDVEGVQLTSERGLTLGLSSRF